MQKIPSRWLFCGDSITDGNHSLCGDPNHIMGHGFAFLAAAFLAAEYPQLMPKSYNTAHSGINSAQLLAAWEKRALNIEPDVLTLLVGVNDTLTLFNPEKSPLQKSLAAPEAYRENLRCMLSLARKQNPQLHILMGIPFYYPAAALPGLSDRPYDAAEKEFILNIRRESQHDRELKAADILTRQLIVREVAEQFKAHILDYPAIFARAAEQAPIEYWVWDGIHPTVAGHMLMFKCWLQSCRDNGIIP